MRKTLFFALVLALGAGVASAQTTIDCSLCTTSMRCDQLCTTCDGIENPDGSCSSTAWSTCGASGQGCIRPGCTPSFQETSRVLRGTYQKNYVVHCDHFRVEWVTQADANQCNTNPALWTRSFCDERKDGWKTNTGSVDCCNGLPSGSQFTCNNRKNC